MKNTFLLSLLIFLLAGPGCGPDKRTHLAAEKIEEIRLEFAPDKRVAVFSVEAVSSGEKIALSGEINLPEAREKLLKLLQEAGLEVEDKIQLLPGESLEGKHFGVVVLSACNIRSEPGHSKELSTQATLGTPLRVYKEEKGWYLVQTPDDYLGWLDPGGFAPMAKEEYDRWMAAEKVVYLPDFGFSQAAPSPDAGRVSDLVAGNILEFVETSGSFAKVRYPDGREAYVPVTDVMSYPLWLASREPNADNIISEAFKFMGRPYLWGGTSGKGVDCSGFTKSVFYLNGILLPRDASQQVHVGVEVPTDTTLANLQPGDLLFFGSKATAEKKERITHVAIYLGDGRIIHSAGAVKVESMRRGDPTFVEDRLESFVRAKRILSSIGENGVELLADSGFY